VVKDIFGDKNSQQKIVEKDTTTTQNSQLKIGFIIYTESDLITCETAILEQG